MSVKIQIKRANAASWTSLDPTLAAGEWGMELDTHKLKIGTGALWSATDYYTDTVALGDLGNVTLSDVQSGDFLRWNGSAWINDPVNLSTDTVGNYVASLVEGTGVTLTNATASEGGTPTIAIGQSVATSASVSFAKVTAELEGNASTATALKNSRIISLTGDVSGSVSFDGSASATISTVIQPNSVALGTDTTGNYVSGLTQGTGVTVTHTPGEGSSPTVAIGQDVGTSSSVQFAAVTAPLIGNASTAATLQNARTISLSGDISGSVSFNGSADVDITATVQPNSVALGTDTTGNYVSGLTQGTGITVTHTPGEGSSPTVAIGQDVATSASVTFAKVDTTGDVTVGGNLTVNGTTTTLNTETLAIEDNVVVLNSNVTGSPSQNAGIEVERGSSDNVSLRWNETTDKWETTEDGLTFSPIITSAYLEDRLFDEHIHPMVRVCQGEEFSGSVVYTDGTLDFDGGYGIGATLENTINELFVVDNFYGSEVGDRVLVTGQADQIRNGIYTITNVGSASQKWKLTRAKDFDGSFSQSITPGEMVFAFEGDVFGGHEYVVNSYGTGPNRAHIIGTDGIDFAQSDGTQTLIAHNGIAFSGNAIGLSELSASVGTGADGRTFLKGLTLDSYGRVTSLTESSLTTTELGVHTSGDYVSMLAAGTGVFLASNSGATAIPSISIGQDVSLSSSVIFARMSAVNVSAQYINAGDITVNNIYGTTIHGALTGNANTATSLQTARTIAGQLFDGSASIAINPTDLVGVTATASEINILDGATLSTAELNYVDGVTSSIQTQLNDKAPLASPTFTGTVTLPDNTVALGTKTTGDYVQNLTQGTGVTITNNSGESASPTIAIGQDVATTASVSFAKVTAAVTGDLTGNVTGNADTATALKNSRSISLSGDLSGSASFDGSGDATISATIQANSVALGTDTTGNYMSDLTQGTGVTITHTPGEGSNATIAIGQAVGTSSSVQFAAVTAPLIGNASTATTLETSRTIALNGDLSGSVSFNGSSDVTLTATVAANSVALGTDTTGNYMSGVSVQNGLTVSHTPGEGSTATVGVDNALLSNFLLEGAAGNSYGLIGTSTYLDVKNTNGYNKEIELDIAAVETKLDTDGYITTTSTSTLTNKTLSSPTLTGTVTIPDNTVALGTKTTGDYVQNLVAGTGVTLTNNSGETATPTVAIGQAVGTSASVTFANITATGTVTLAADPSLALQAATKQYVDSFISGINWHQAVVAATTGNLAGTYNNGTSGIGATITKASNGSIGTIDGAAVIVGSRILLKSQTDAKQNGAYTVTAVGSAGAPWVVTRATDMDNSGADGTIVPGDAIFVLGGSTNANQGFIQTTVGTGTNGAIVLGTDDVVFTQFTGTAALTAGTGMSITGNTLDVGTASSSRIVVNDNDIDLASGVISATGTYKSVTVDTYGRVTAGTNPTTLSGYGITDAAPIASPTFTGTVSGITKTMVGLGSVDNTADTAKPVSTAQQTALDLKANLASPTFTGTPTLPTGTIATTQTAGNNTTAVATTAYVDAADALKANLASPTFTGTPTLPTGTIATTQSAADSTTKVATTAFVTTADNLKANIASPTFTGTVTIPAGASISGFAPLASPTFTGTPTLPTGTIATTQSASNNSTAVATTAYVDAADALKANLASPTFTGTPLSTTAAADTNSTQIATTAYVVGQGYAKLASPTFTGTVTLPSGTVTSTMILDGTIANADISTTAAIDLGKLADVSTTAASVSYTLVLTDKNKIVEISNASGNTLTVPLNSIVAFPVGSQITILQTGAGQTTITPATAGVTINGTPGLKLRAQWSSATLISGSFD